MTAPATAAAGAGAAAAAAQAAADRAVSLFGADPTEAELRDDPVDGTALWVLNTVLWAPQSVVLQMLARAVAVDRWLQARSAEDAVSADPIAAAAQTAKLLHDSPHRYVSYRYAPKPAADTPIAQFQALCTYVDGDSDGLFRGAGAAPHREQLERDAQQLYPMGPPDHILKRATTAARATKTTHFARHVLARCVQALLTWRVPPPPPLMPSSNAAADRSSDARTATTTTTAAGAADDRKAAEEPVMTTASSSSSCCLRLDRCYRSEREHGGALESPLTRALRCTCPSGLLLVHALLDLHRAYGVDASVRADASASPSAFYLACDRADADADVVSRIAAVSTDDALNARDPDTPPVVHHVCDRIKQQHQQQRRAGGSSASSVDTPLLAVLAVCCSPQVARDDGSGLQVLLPYVDESRQQMLGAAPETPLQHVRMLLRTSECAGGSALQQRALADACRLVEAATVRVRAYARDVTACVRAVLGGTGTSATAAEAVAAPRPSAVALGAVVATPVPAPVLDIVCGYALHPLRPASDSP